MYIVCRNCRLGFYLIGFDQEVNYSALTQTISLIFLPPAEYSSNLITILRSSEGNFNISDPRLKSQCLTKTSILFSIMIQPVFRIYIIYIQIRIHFKKRIRIRPFNGKFNKKNPLNLNS